ncbi:hypothetical protein PM082_000698 [Marasmius tenuissimus]|nr:hypothetical protein PM082_000698 [Marasmius tenuissimus]
MGDCCDLVNWIRFWMDITQIFGGGGLYDCSKPRWVNAERQRAALTRPPESGFSSPRVHRTQFPPPFKKEESLRLSIQRQSKRVYELRGMQPGREGLGVSEHSLVIFIRRFEAI